MKIKHPILAGLLNLLFPGLGGLYTGEWKAALVELVEAVVIAGGLLLLNGWWIRSEPPFPFFICPAFSILIYAFAMFNDGFTTCRRHNNKVVKERKSDLN